MNPDVLRVSAATRLQRVSMTRRWIAALGAAVLATALLLFALQPGSAAASLPAPPGPGQLVGGLLGGIGGAIGGTVGHLAVSAFDAVIHALFAPIAHFINTQLIGWLVAVPDYASPGSHVAATERTLLAMAGAALAAVATISIARYWAAGLAGSGVSALEGLMRTVAAALILPLWPWVFHASVGLANQASAGLLGSASVTKDSANLLALGVGAGVGFGVAGLGLFVSIAMAIVASILFLGLLMMKIVLAISTVLVFIGMPIAIVLWPVTPWVTRVLGRAFGVCLAVPLVWSMCFAASGAMLNDGLLLKGSSGFFDGLLEPLAAIALLWIMLMLPTKLAHVAMLGAGALGGGFASRTVSYAAGSQLRDMTRQHMPSWGSGASNPAQASTGGSDTRLGTRLGAESVLAASRVAAGPAAAVAGGAAMAGGRAVGGSPTPPVGRSANGNGTSNGSGQVRSGLFARVRASGESTAYSPPPLGSSGAAIAASGGLQRPSWRQQDFDAEMLEAALRERRQPVSVERAAQARDALPESTRAAVGELVAEHGPGARQHLAYQALGAWSPGQREALRTLAAASPEVRAEAFSDSGTSVAGFAPTTRQPTSELAHTSGGRTPQAPGPQARPAESGAPTATSVDDVTEVADSSPVPREPTDPPSTGSEPR
jgi:hypothetical protein